MYELVSLNEAKNWLKISTSNTDKDTFLGYLILEATRLVEQYLSKKVITRQFIEYHDGEGVNNLLVRYYPIYKVSSIYDDTNHDFGSSDLISSDDYRIYYDRGEVKLVEDESAFAKGRQNVKITYWAGYSRFELIDEANNYIDLKESGGSEVNVELTPPTTPDDTAWQGYSAEDMASALQTALNADDSLNFVYTVSYNHATQKFTISTGTSFEILWSEGSSAAKDIGNLLGYTTTSTDTGAATYTSDNAVSGVPEEIKLATKMIIDFMYQQSPQGAKGGVLMEKRRTLPDGSVELIKEIPDSAKQILDSYARVF